MYPKALRAIGCSCLILASGCNLEHHAPIRSAELPPLAPPVLHANRLLVDVRDGVGENVCVSPQNARVLCFEHLRAALSEALMHSLWTSFPRIDLGGDRDRNPGDYVLHVELSVEALPPDPNGPGWSAGVRGSWRLDRDGRILAGNQVASRSRADFAYGAPLGVGAGEALDAIAVSIGTTLGAVPESHIVAPVPLPQVAVAPLSLSPVPATSPATSSSPPELTSQSTPANTGM